MRVSIAESLGMCFGVRDAVEMALNSPHREDLTVLGDLVHNPVVLAELDRAGIRRCSTLAEAPATGHVMITAHGASNRAIAAAVARGYQVIEATCPLVRHAHRALARLVSAGYHPVIIGRAEHVEVQGLVGDLDDYTVILEPEDVPRLAGRPMLGVVAQTTQPLDLVLDRVRQIREAFPGADVRFVDTVCQPTKERQEAARRLAARVDLMVVVGGRSSNNTLQLARACEAEGAPTRRVEGPDDLRAGWFDGVQHVGVTAGTSTPDATIAAVVRWLGHAGAALPAEQPVSVESPGVPAG